MATQADIQMHYDPEQALFSTMLGQSMTYSGAEWSTARTLDEAQTAKMEKILGFAGVDASTRSLLDLGCGWGSLLLHAGRTRPNLRTLVGITLSEEQREFAASRTVDPRHSFELKDCFEVLSSDDRVYDSAVSVGAFEHFANGQLYRQGLHLERYRSFFQGCRRRVRGGLGLQSIVSLKKVREIPQSKRGAYLACLQYLNREIFPNSLLPSVAEIETAFAGIYRAETMHVTTENYRLTLSAWRQNLLAEQARFDPFVVARFEKYLDLCIEQFAEGHIGLAQFALRPIVGGVS